MSHRTAKRNTRRLLAGCLGLACLIHGPVKLIASEPETEGTTEERFIPNYAAGDLYYLWSTRADLEGSEASLQVQEAGTRIPVPIFSSERSRLTAGVDFRWNSLDFSSPDRTLELYRLQLPIDFWHDFNDRWKAWGRVEPGLFTDFKAFNEAAFAVTVLALASYQFSPAFSAAFGVYYSRDLGEDRLLPALGLIWKPNPHWNVGLTFPRASVSYAPTKQWLFTALVAPGGAGWSVKDDLTGEDYRLNYTSWRAGLSAEYQLTQVGPAKLWVFLSGGYQFGQELEIQDGNDNTLSKQNIENGQFVSGGVRLRF